MNVMRKRIVDVNGKDVNDESDHESVGEDHMAVWACFVYGRAAWNHEHACEYLTMSENE